MNRLELESSKCGLWSSVSSGIVEKQMSLTKSERTLVAEKASEYPPGVPSYRWGFGPMVGGWFSAMAAETLLEYG